jgi:alpha-L-fucosidase 2
MIAFRSFSALLIAVSAIVGQAFPQPQPWHNLMFPQLSATWDEGIPLGNGLIGALVWKKDTQLRVSLDRADLWDLRPTAGLSDPGFTFAWVVKQVQKGAYAPVQERGDAPYDRDPAPTKIPGAALEFPIEMLGAVSSVRLSLDSALCIVEWTTGARGMLFVHPTLPVGWFRFENIPSDFLPEILPPPYTSRKKSDAFGVDGQDLRRLGYTLPAISRGKENIRYRQNGYGGFRYEVATRWRRVGGSGIEGVWSVSADPSYSGSDTPATEECTQALARGFDRDFQSHLTWWHAFWDRSSVQVPDSVLERQWYLETYKFGAASRRGAPPITLQAVWTADNGRLPPWKGDFHNDLNTQLSYWPCYSGNRLDDGLAFLDWLWKCRPAAKKYTSRYYGKRGLNFPGVATLRGEPMGGWIQYSLGPTVSAWLAQHFYLHWRYSMDRTFLAERAYPWLRETSTFVEQLSVSGRNGRRKLALSSSPEINDNSINAWFTETTNFDLALIRWLLGATAELAEELKRPSEASHWRTLLSEWPALARSETDGKLLVAPGTPLKESHRHFSHLMAIYPLGLLNPDNGQQDRNTILASLADLKRLGTDAWCGYSYSWLANLQARARNGEEAADALRTFADCFVLKNSFHANGDQSRTGKSKYTYRPFTLEGNFAFASGLQEMLLQSHGGRVILFPAVPHRWTSARFTRLRAEGAFVVSATMRDGHVDEVTVHSDSGGVLLLADPFGIAPWSASGIQRERIARHWTSLEISCQKGEEFTLRRER